MVAQSQDSGKEPCASRSRRTGQASSSIHPMGQVLGMQVHVLLVGRRILAPGLCTCQGGPRTAACSRSVPMSEPSRAFGYQHDDVISEKPFVQWTWTLLQQRPMCSRSKSKAQSCGHTRSAMGLLSAWGFLPWSNLGATLDSGSGSDSDSGGSAPFDSEEFGPAHCVGS